MADMAVAKTILEQLGGKRFLVMTGAKNLLGSPSMLQMDVRGSGPAGAVNRVEVWLDASDTYTVKAYRVHWGRDANGTRAWKVNDHGSEAGIYCDQLQAAFTRLTGLHTRL